MNNLSVIIPSRTLSNLIPCVQAVAQHEESLDMIVVWDRSNGNPLRDLLTPSRVGSDFPRFEYQVREVDEPFIYARNCNIGIRSAGDNDVILLNDDALLRTPGGFTAMQQAAADNPQVGIIGAVTNITGQPLQQPRGVGLREVDHFAFVCVLIPRRTIKLIGMLDERYSIDYGVEDRDYCETVRRLGMKCFVYDHCFVDHSQLKSTFRGDPTASLSYARNWELFRQKWGMTA